MNKLFGSVLGMAVGAWVVKPVIRRAKIRAAILYLETIRSAREAVMVFGVVAFCIALMAGGAVLIPLALCLFMPWQPQTKTLVACAFGAVYIAVPFIVATVLMSEKRWMRMTRADAFVNNVIDKD